jgi:preprotein translocase subunit SecA
MTRALAQYHALYESLRSRRRRPFHATGLDVFAERAGVAARFARSSRSRLLAEARRVDGLAATLHGYSEAVLDESVREIREVFVRGRQDAAAIRRALALVREVARRQTGEEAFIVQLVGALAMYHGRVIEMLTGEGKTLTGSLIAPLIAWQHKHLHVLTVNDYLARRDAHSRGEIYRRCLPGPGANVGAIQPDQEPAERFSIYSRAIVYGTPKQITADWLRDQIRLGRMNSPWAGRQLLLESGGIEQGGEGRAGQGPMIPGLRAAMVDEADAVLIDEGVVPLIIARSRRQDDMAEVYLEAAAVAAKLDEGPDYTMDHLRRKAELKRRGEHRVEQLTAPLPAPIWRASRRAEELVRQALVARHCYLRGHQYQIVDGRIVIVDEYTGRFLADRSWEHGLHQAVEAKEGVEVTADRETLARMSFQRFFRSYPFLCGMTGTAADATGEIETIYARPVTVIPTNRPVIREKWKTRVFRSAAGKWAAIIDSINEVHAQNRPLLVGTRSIQASEFLSQRLAARGLEHKVLNANFDADEAGLIAEAGHAGAVTVATNMAGRGTDIKLDGRALKAGGLHVILTEMHTAKRIDRQFIGRAGRQGDPGSSQTFVSLEDDLVRHYTPNLATALARRSRAEELTPGPATRGLFRLAQKRAEARARRSRASVLKQDDWIEKTLPG